jgi:hypothetical protein
VKRPVRGMPANPRGASACALVAALAFVVAIAGCGGGGESTSTSQASVPQPEQSKAPSHPTADAVKAPTPEAPQAKAQPKRAPATKPEVQQGPASANSKALPATDSDSKAARESGRKACAGMTALEAAKHFAVPARLAGTDKQFAELVAEPSPSTESSPGYPRLVAALYATTVPAVQREQAAAGCAEELTPPSGG